MLKVWINNNDNNEILKVGLIIIIIVMRFLKVGLVIIIIIGFWKFGLMIIIIRINRFWKLS